MNMTEYRLPVCRWKNHRIFFSKYIDTSFLSPLTSGSGKKSSTFHDRTIGIIQLFFFFFIMNSDGSPFRGGHAETCTSRGRYINHCSRQEWRLAIPKRKNGRSHCTQRVEKRIKKKKIETGRNDIVRDIHSVSVYRKQMEIRSRAEGDRCWLRYVFV